MDCNRLSSDEPAIPSQDGIGHANDFYEDYAQSYADRTLNAAAPPLFDRFVAELTLPSRVLDLGCGGGRELRSLARLGHDCLGVDLSPRLAAIAEARSGMPVLVADMRSLQFRPRRFDGVIAIASLLHLDDQDRDRLLSQIASWLAPDGLFLVTMKVGHGVDRAEDGRAYSYIEPDAWQAQLRSCGLHPVQTRLSPGVSDISSSGHDWYGVLAHKAQ